MAGIDPAGGEIAGIAQILALADAADVEVRVENEDLVVVAPVPKLGVAQAIGAYLDAFGRERVIAFLIGTPREERQRLAAIPPVPRRVFATRLVPI